MLKRIMLKNKYVLHPKNRVIVNVQIEFLSKMTGK